MRPTFAFAVLDIPFELLKAWRKTGNFWQPGINYFFVSPIELSVLSNEFYFPIWKLFRQLPRIGGGKAATISGLDRRAKLDPSAPAYRPSCLYFLL